MNGCLLSPFFDLFDLLGLFKTLLTLDLSKNGLLRFPQQIFEMPNLQWLNLSQNLVSIIPEEISKPFSKMPVNFHSDVFFCCFFRLPKAGFQVL